MVLYELEWGLRVTHRFEPERVARGTYLATTHPELVLGGANGGLVDLGSPPAWDFIHEYLSQCVESYKIDVLRIDYNIDPLAIWQTHDKLRQNRSGVTEVRYIEGLYRLWDSLLASPTGPQFIDGPY